MSEAVENLRKRLKRFDPDEVRSAMLRAQLRLECEEHLGEIMERHTLDRGTVLRIIHQASQHEVKDLAELLDLVHQVASTVTGDSDDRLDDAATVLRNEAPATSLKQTVDAMQNALQAAMSSEMGRVVSSSTP